jgi:hypothetical protein
MMTEEQRVKLEELITEYGNKEYTRSHDCSEYALSETEKARNRITKHLDMIQWSAALYNLRRAGKPFDISISMDEK